jgi:hypothetical protein
MIAIGLDQERRLLPVWHGVDQRSVSELAPMLADLVATSSQQGIPGVVEDILSAVSSRSPRSAPDLSVLDAVDYHILSALHGAFGASYFHYSQIADHMDISERFRWRFDGLIHRGYLDRDLDPTSRTRQFRLAPQIDFAKLSTPDRPPK